MAEVELVCQNPACGSTFMGNPNRSYFRKYCCHACYVAHLRFRRDQALEERNRQKAAQPAPVNPADAWTRWEWKDDAPLVVRCALCDWTFAGGAAEGVQAQKAHRAEAHGITDRVARDLNRGRLKRPVPDSERPIPMSVV